MRDGFILGRKLKDAEGSRQESLLQYHRPILEDGEVSYEFEFLPGQAGVHPALGRLAFLVEPDGVKIHRLGDSPDNLPNEPNSRRGPTEIPLKPNAWNRMVLSVAGDTLTLRLNGEVILERPIEPTSSRAFGLFHLIDQGEARVRGVTYRGGWPRVRPNDLGFGGHDQSR
jgi:hypothetical protein